MRATNALKEPGPFEGFEPHALDFFTELEAHQTRDWFLPNKDRYRRLIRRPLGQLVGWLVVATQQQCAPTALPAAAGALARKRSIGVQAWRQGQVSSPAIPSPIVNRNEEN